MNNGKDRTTPTADTVRKDGLDVAEHIRALASAAKAEGEALAAMAEEVAGIVTKASDEVASRVTDYLEKCAAARTAMHQHQQALTVPMPAPAPVHGYQELPRVRAPQQPPNLGNEQTLISAVEHGITNIPPRSGR